MAEDSEREDGEHVISEETSWEEMVERLDSDQHLTESDAKDGVSGEDRTGAETTGGGDVAETHDSGVADRSREGEERIEHRRDDAAGPAAAPAVGAADGIPGADAAVSEKRIKRSRKELLALLNRNADILAHMESEIEKTKLELGAKSDRLIRMVAEFENYKKRTRREWELHQKRANAELIKDLLGVMDDLERALEASGDGGDQFKDGIRLIHSELLDVLKRSGLKEIEALNLAFDPQYHEALGEVASEDVEGGHVLQVVQKGYLLHDQLLRPAKVIIARSKES